MLATLFALSLSLLHPSHAQIKTYQKPLGPSTPKIAFKAYDNITLLPPPLPVPLPALDFPINLPLGGMPGMGQPTQGNLMTLSIELSIANKIIGETGHTIYPEFLNFMSALKWRGGTPVVRVGGNTQEKAVVVDSIENGDTIRKTAEGATGFTQTPTVYFTEDILHALGNVSNLIGVRWWLGIPLNDTLKPRLRVAEVAERLFGDYIVGFQLGNEPDLFFDHKYRLTEYGIPEYMEEFQVMLGHINNDPDIPRKNIIGGPSVCCRWTLEQVLEAGYFERFGAQLNTLIVEQYPANNCPPEDTGDALQQVLNDFGQHSRHVVNFANRYRIASQQALARGLPIILLETNTGSCGGWAGVSDSFISALWGADYAMQFATINFTTVHYHLGGQGVAYDPFVNPPAERGSRNKWTVGPIFYAHLIVAEALGRTGRAQVVDLFPNNRADHTPAYGIYENGQPQRILLINYMSSTDGRVDYTARITIGPPGAPAPLQRVWVRHVTIPEGEPAGGAYKGKVYIANMTFGGRFESDGNLYGTDDTQEVACTNNVCPVRVRGPSMALVFLNEQALRDSGVGPEGGAPEKYTTTYFTKTKNTATVDPTVLATSNGQGGAVAKHVYGSSSSGQMFHQNAARAVAAVSVPVLGAALVGGWVVLRRTLFD